MCFDALPDHSRQCEYAFARTVRANSYNSREQFARIIRVSVKRHWRTFPDLRLIYGWHVITSWARCPLWVNQPGILSLPSLWGRKMSSNQCMDYMDYGRWRPLNGRPGRCARGCLVVRLAHVCDCAGLAYSLYRLHVRPSLWRTALLKLQLPLVALYKCYAFTFTFYYRHRFQSHFQPCLCKLSRYVWVSHIKSLYMYFQTKMQYNARQQCNLVSRPLGYKPITWGYTRHQHSHWHALWSWRSG